LLPHPSLPKPPKALPTQVKQERPYAPAAPPHPPDAIGEAAASSDPNVDNQRPSEAEEEGTEPTDPIDRGAIPLELAKYDNGAPVAADYIQEDGSISCQECRSLKDAKGAHFCPVQTCSALLCAQCTVAHIHHCLPYENEYESTPMCKFFLRGRCRRSRDCPYSHDVQLRNDTLEANDENQNYATCVTHKRRRKTCSSDKLRTPTASSFGRATSTTPQARASSTNVLKPPPRATVTKPPRHHHRMPPLGRP
jgi:hypothetical protein